jgi:thiol-disulfide isomerase/thioredoxin
MNTLLKSFGPTGALLVIVVSVVPGAISARAALAAETGAARAPAQSAAASDAPAGTTSQTGAGIAVAQGRAPDSAQSSTPRASADFSFTDLRGGQHTLSETRGRATLLEFWASWCVPCRKGFPFLDSLQQKYAGAGLAVVAVTLEEDGDAVSEFVDSHPSRFLIGRDPTGRAGEIFEVGAIPTALLLGPDGQILARFEGGTDTVHRQIEEAVGAVVRGESLDPALAALAGAGKANALAWQREYLADPIMNLDGDILTRSMREHVHASKEGAAGNGGVAGGGCGCN